MDEHDSAASQDKQVLDNAESWSLLKATDCARYQHEAMLSSQKPSASDMES